jgi:hypothetical protein
VITPTDPHWNPEAHALVAGALYGVMRARNLLPSIELPAWPEADQRASEWAERGLAFARTEGDRLRKSLRRARRGARWPEITLEEARQVHGGLDLEGLVSPLRFVRAPPAGGRERAATCADARCPTWSLRGARTRVFLEELAVGELVHEPGAEWKLDVPIPPELEGRELLNLRFESDDYVYRGPDLRHCVVFRLEARRARVRSRPMSSPQGLPTALAARLAELDRRALERRDRGRPASRGRASLSTLSARGLSTALVERGDWAGGDVQRVVAPDHGGLRYLEQFELALVRDSCLERGLLLQNAAGLVWPERFVFPSHRGTGVGRWKMAAGLSLYTLVSVPRVLGLPRFLGRRAVQRFVPGIRADGFDGRRFVSRRRDARRAPHARGRPVRSRPQARSRSRAWRCSRLENGRSGASVRLVDRLSGEERTLTARAVVLAGGPFSDELRARAGLDGTWIRPTRGRAPASCAASGCPRTAP